MKFVFLIFEAKLVFVSPFFTLYDLGGNKIKLNLIHIIALKTKQVFMQI